MPNRFDEEDLSKIKPLSIHERRSKVHIGDVVRPNSSRRGLESYPNILAGASLRAVVDALRVAKEQRREIIWLVGAHTIKCGLSGYISELMDGGYITAMATTGSAVIHDIELALFGATSEDVGEELPKGRFGMSKETSDHFYAACRHAGERGMGLGEGVGSYLGEQRASNADLSVFARAASAGIPVTVHVALGTDITHQRSDFPAALVGELSMKDFRILCSSVGRLFDAGVVVIFGSAVVLPEVFLKAVSINYNLGRSPRAVTAASFDMIQHYRVRENVLSRPFQGDARAYSITGHHEIMLPLLYSLLSEA